MLTVPCEATLAVDNENLSSDSDFFYIDLLRKTSSRQGPAELLYDNSTSDCHTG